MIEVLQPDEEDPDQELSEEEQKEALLQHLDLLPDKDLKFIEEEVVSFVDNPGSSTPLSSYVCSTLCLVLNCAYHGTRAREPQHAYHLTGPYSTRRIFTPKRASATRMTCVPARIFVSSPVLPCEYCTHYTRRRVSAFVHSTDLRVWCDQALDAAHRTPGQLRYLPTRSDVTDNNT
eukprot:3877485-Rhodomonas_salina.4